MLFPQNDIFQHFRLYYSYAFIISSPELKSVKKILKPTRESRKFESLLERQELLQDLYSINPDLHFVILNVISSE